MTTVASYTEFDVCGALPKYLARLGHEVAVFMPLYRQAHEWLEANGGGQTIGQAQIAPYLLGLARKGHDSRYGARPLKRAIERHLLAPLAGQMNAYTADTAVRDSTVFDNASQS